MKKQVLLLLIGLFGLTAHGQNPSVSLRGQVSVNKEKIGGVLITVENMNLGTITDANGQFELAVPEGKQTLMFRVNGVMRLHHAAEFNKDNKYHWDVAIGPKYSSAYLIKMKNEGREDEIEESVVDVRTFTLVHGVVQFDALQLAGATVAVPGLGLSTKTDGQGRFELWVPEGIQEIEFGFRGFDSFAHKVQIDPAHRYLLQARFGPAYSKEFLAQKQAEGTLDQLKRSECEVLIE